MQISLPKNFSRLMFTSLGRKIILRFIYIFRFYFKCQRRLFSFKQAPLIVIIVLFTIFSYFEITAITNESFLAKLLLQKQEIIIETGLLTVSDKSEDQQKQDFQIAAWREDDIIDISEDSEIALILGGSILVAPETEVNEIDFLSITRTEIEKYIVQPGDTISTIAENFGLKWSTVLWENNLGYWSVIRPGDGLKILPIDGITHKVKTGENLSYLAKKYKASTKQITEFNNLTEESILKPGEILIIPEGTPPPPPAPKYQSVAPQLVQENYSNYWDWRSNTKCHRFVSRQCTDWAAFKWATEQGQCVPSWSHAKYWYRKAQKDGYETGASPRQGAIMVLTCTSWICGYYGHVAYVESFDESTVTISEMNGLKRRQYSERSLKNITKQWQNGWKILGYIYTKSN
ncbi:LysM peptidoglycan-binding domain-containing protein [Patescibacteria group bacterium]|nr:LysM peptidoglycan-binding domain-containing protein [Patescibacteria group bacterium]